MWNPDFNIGALQKDGINNCQKIKKDLFTTDE